MRSFQKGFSLVELMIVVAIIGILAAIAIPNFVTMQLKAKRSEVPGNVDGIKTAEQAYDAAFDGFMACTESPRAAASLNKTPVDFNTSSAGWTSLGWRPDGQVRGSYSVTTATTDFTVSGASDVDDDNSVAIYTATNSINATLVATTQNYY